MRGWSGDSEKVEKTRSCLLKVWDGLQSGADKDNDGQVRGAKKFLLIFFFIFNLNLDASIGGFFFFIPVLKLIARKSYLEKYRLVI